MSDFLRAKYGSHTVDIVVTGGPQAYRFMRRHQDDLFVNTPVLVIATSLAAEDQAKQDRFLSIASDLQPRPTLELATRLQPHANEIVVVTGASEFDRNWEERIKKIFADWQTHPPVRYLSGLPLDDVLSELSHLPPNTIVYSPGMQRDGSGHAYANRDVVQRMAQVSSAPLYSSYSTMINYGIVGGYVFEMGDQGSQAGEIVRRILNGEKLTQRTCRVLCPRTISSIGISSNDGIFPKQTYRPEPRL